MGSSGPQTRSSAACLDDPTQHRFRVLDGSEPDDGWVDPRCDRGRRVRQHDLDWAGRDNFGAGERSLPAFDDHHAPIARRAARAQSPAAPRVPQGCLLARSPGNTSPDGLDRAYGDGDGPLHLRLGRPRSSVRDGVSGDQHGRRSNMEPRGTVLLLRGRTRAERDVEDRCYRSSMGDRVGAGRQLPQSHARRRSALARHRLPLGRTKGHGRRAHAPVVVVRIADPVPLARLRTHLAPCGVLGGAVG